MRHTMIHDGRSLVDKLIASECTISFPLCKKIAQESLHAHDQVGPKVDDGLRGYSTNPAARPLARHSKRVISKDLGRDQTEPVDDLGPICPSDGADLGGQQSAMRAHPKKIIAHGAVRPCAEILKERARQGWSV